MNIYYPIYLQIQNNLHKVWLFKLFYINCVYFYRTSTYDLHNTQFIPLYIMIFYYVQTNLNLLNSTPL
jgi:hypothetical protein